MLSPFIYALQQSMLVYLLGFRFLFTRILHEFPFDDIKLLPFFTLSEDEVIIGQGNHFIKLGLLWL